MWQGPAVIPALLPCVLGTITTLLEIPQSDPQAYADAGLPDSGNAHRTLTSTVPYAPMKEAVSITDGEEASWGLPKEMPANSLLAIFATRAPLRVPSFCSVYRSFRVRFVVKELQWRTTNRQVSADITRAGLLAGA